MSVWFCYTTIAGKKVVGDQVEIFAAMSIDFVTRDIPWVTLLSRLTKQEKEQTICAICQEQIRKNCWWESDPFYVHSACSQMFHSACLNKWVSYKPGERIILAKSRCPVCRNRMEGIKVIEAPKNSEKIPHFQCLECKEIFGLDSSQQATCGGSDEPERATQELCDRCWKKKQGVFPCPRCGLLLERSGGCRLFACCRYGRDGCKKEACDHGSTASVRFCGHRFEVTLEASDFESLGFGLSERLVSRGGLPRGVMEGLGLIW